MTEPQQVTVPALATVPGVDLVATGDWDLSTGTATFTTEQLAAAVDAASCSAIGPPRIKLGHLDDRFANPQHDGTPALGLVKNMTLAAEGNKIVGDLVGMPGWLAAILPSAYPQRSVEAHGPVKCQIGHTHPFVISALALLGITKPGIGVLSSLDDVAALYDVQAAGPDAWRLTMPVEDNMPPQVLAAGITVDDVRRAYYDASDTPYSYWITEMQLSPPQLIVCDESTNNLYRVPVKISGDKLTFGDAVQVQVEYSDVAAAARLRKALDSRALVWASAAESRAGIVVRATWDSSTALKNMGSDPSKAAIKKMFALPGTTKSDSKLPHHDCSADGVVGAANTGGCSAAIGAINGAHGGLKGVSAAQAKAAYNHCASHLRKAGQEPPEYSGPSASASERLEWLIKYAYRAQQHAAAAADLDESATALIASLDATLDQASAQAGMVDRTKVPAEAAQALDMIVAAEAIVDQLMDMLGIYDPDDETPDTETAAALAAGKHAVYSGSHSHPHAAYGGQGSDQSHEHQHSHSNDAVHNHAHAGAGHKGREGGSAVDFKLTDEQTAQLRKDLGLAEGAELSVDDLLAAAKATAEKASGVAASAAGVQQANLPDSVVVIDRDAWDEQGKRIAKMEAAETRRRTEERDTVIRAAVKAGKFGPAKAKEWAANWDKNPEGTRALIAGLTSNVVPVQDIGAGGLADADEEFEREYRHLFGPLQGKAGA